VAKSLPRQKRGESKQDYQTPAIFLAAVCTRLGINGFDLDAAADADNAVCDRFYTIEDNALVQPWAGLPGWVWCNPPFGNLAPWVAHAHAESLLGAQIAMLVPAAIGANWWRDYVHNKAQVIGLNGRITFVGETNPYPKDCCLLLYGGPEFPRYDIWTWMNDAPTG